MSHILSRLFPLPSPENFMVLLLMMLGAFFMGRWWEARQLNKFLRKLRDGAA